MIGAFVLRRARFSADVIVGTVDTCGRSVQDACPHASDYYVKGIGRSLGIVACGVRSVGGSCRVFVDVWRDEPATIGNEGGQITELQRRDGYLALSHSYPHDGSSVPAGMLFPQVFGVRNNTTGLAFHVDT